MIFKKMYLYTIRFLSLFVFFYHFTQLKLGLPFRDVSISLARYTGRLGIYARQYYYKATLLKFGCDVVIASGSYIVYRETEIGSRVAIEEDCVISLCSIGDDSILAHRVSLMSGGNQHEIDNLNIKFRESILPLKKIHVGENVWIGTHSVILNNVLSGSVVGASSVVTKPVGNNMVVAGVPAKVIRQRGQ